MGTPTEEQAITGSHMSRTCFFACLLLLPAASQAAVQDRGLFGDVIGGILGGDNATVDATTPANADAPSDIVGTLMQVIPLILTSNGTLPMDQIGEAFGIQKEPIASPFTKPVQFAA